MNKEVNREEKSTVLGKMNSVLGGSLGREHFI